VSVRQSLLAILNQGPCYGYQLRAEFDRRTGGAWPINVGQIYTTLDRLERDGLVRRGTSEVEGQIVYEITDAGVAASEEWIAALIPRTSTPRDELAIKLSLAATLPGVDARAIIAAQRESTVKYLDDLDRSRPSAVVSAGEELATAIVTGALRAAAQAELSWLAETAELLSAAVQAGNTGALTLNTEPPKRGRPPKSAV
jgi:DNA-binding PadR family transcriptional regulator